MTEPQAPGASGARNLVLEGADTAGKSTISRLFATADHTVIHCAYNPRYGDMYAYYRSLIQDTPGPVIFDRSFISEEAYGPVLRGGSRLSTSQFNALLHLLKQRDFVVIYAREEVNILRSRLAESSREHELVVAKVPELLAAYDACMRTVSAIVPTLIVRPTEVPLGHLKEHIVQGLNTMS